MPTYYVRPDGNDLNTGLTPTNAAGTGSYRTVNKALSVAVGGDTVWIAPGTYRENLNPTIALQSTNINVYGDAALTQIAWGSGLTVGIVRITNNLTNDVTAPSGAVLTLSSKGFYTFKNLRFDGWMTMTNSPSVFFDDCVVYAGCKESSFTQTTFSPLMRVDFKRCELYEFPAYHINSNVGDIAPTISYQSCLLSVCVNADRPSATSPAGSISSFFHLQGQKSNNNNLMMSNYFNCTLIPGRNQPNYIFACWAWTGRLAMAVTNTLILAVANTNTFTNDFGNQATQSYNAGFSLSNNGWDSGAGNITLNYMPVDIQEGYKQSSFQYLPYTPIVGSVLVGAGANATVGNYSTPTFDFSNNTWRQANPTIGYMDNRQVSTVPSTAGYVPLDRSIQTLTVTAGETGKSVHVYLGSTGVTFQTPNLTCYYARNNGTSVNIPLVAGNASTWVSGSLFEVSAVTMPGVYKFDVPNAVIEAGATTASIMLRGANAFNGAFVNINIEQPAQSAYLSTLGYKFLSEYAGSDGVLTVNKRTVTTVKCQIADTNGTAVAIGSSTMTVEVYTGSNVLLASYTPTIQYAGNGHVTFVLDTQITGTAGTYNAYAIRSASTTDRAVFGPLQIKVNEL